MEALRNVFVRLPNWVGDLVMATPALRALRRAHPAARIVAGIRGYGRPVLDGLQSVDEFWEIERGDERIGPGLVRYVRRLGERRFDLAVFFTNSLTSALGPALARIPERVGYAGDWRSPLLTRRVPREDRKAPVPMPRYYLDLLATLGVSDAGPAYEVPVLDSDAEAAARLFAEKGVDPTRPVAAINPGARFGSSKLWAPDRFAAIGDRLVDHGHQVMILCAPGEVEIARTIAQAMRRPSASTHGAAIPLRTLRGVVARLGLMVTTDTGPRHLAAGLGVPTVVVMGSTHPGWTEWAMETTRVVRRDVPCGPCHLRRCPFDHACMELVTVDLVWGAVLDVLAADRSRSDRAISLDPASRARPGAV